MQLASQTFLDPTTCDTPDTTRALDANKRSDPRFLLLIAGNGVRTTIRLPQNSGVMSPACVRCP